MNSVIRHICGVKNSRLGPDLPTSVNDSDFAISRVFYFHETSHAYAKFREIKTFAKIFEFTVCFLVIQHILFVISHLP